MSMLNMLLASGGKKLLSVGWSGSSVATWPTSITTEQVGVDTTGFLYRFLHTQDGISISGLFKSVNTSGVFSGDSYDSNGSGINASGNLIRTVFGVSSSTWVSFDADSGFSGSASALPAAGAYFKFETSNKLVRFIAKFTSQFTTIPESSGTYISLT